MEIQDRANGHRFVRFLAGNWKPVVFLILAPIAAIFGAIWLIRHTGWMTHDPWNVRRWPAVDTHSPGIYVLHGLLFCSIVLVFLNTLAYAFEAWKKREPKVMGLYGLALATILLWASEVYVGWGTRQLMEQSSDWAKHIHDLYAVVVFLLFAIMDFLLYCKAKANRVPAVPPPSVSQRLQEETFLLQLLMVDVPVVAGIVSVNLFLHELLEGALALGTSPGAQGFLVGLGAGALLMQLVLSQFVFLVIYSRYFLVEYQALPRS